MPLATIAETTGARSPPAGTPTPTCSSRSAPPARRIEQIEQAKAVCRQCAARAPASSSPWPPTRTPASGAAPPRRSAASCAGQWLARQRRTRLSLPSLRARTRSRPRRRGGGRLRARPSPCGAPRRRPRCAHDGAAERYDGARRSSSRPAPGRSSPPSSVVTSVRTIDRPRPVAASSAKSSGRPDRRRPPASTARSPSLSSTTTTVPGACASREGVVDRVLQQLVEHHRQRRGDRGRQLAGVARRPGSGSGAPATTGPPRPCGRAGRTISMNGDVVARLARQRLVHEGDRADPPHRLLDRRLGLGRREAPALQPQQRRDRLQVVLHPVVDLADRGVLGQQQPVPAAQLGDVAEQHARRRSPCRARAAGCSGSAR